MEPANRRFRVEGRRARGGKSSLWTLSPVCTYASELHVYFYTYTYVYTVYIIYTCVQHCLHAQLQYLLFPDVSQVICQANVQCVLVYTMNTSHVFLLFTISDTAHGT